LGERKRCVFSAIEVERRLGIKKTRKKKECKRKETRTQKRTRAEDR